MSNITWTTDKDDEFGYEDLVGLNPAFSFSVNPDRNNKKRFSVVFYVFLGEGEGEEFLADSTFVSREDAKVFCEKLHKVLSGTPADE